MVLTKVTFTGADDETPPAFLAEISKMYPFVEWGILVGFYLGCERWPSRLFFNKLLSLPSHELQLSLHLCGESLTNLLFDTGRPILNEWEEEALPLFQRVQLNFHGDVVVEVVEVPYIVEAFQGKFAGKEAILQLDGVNDWVLDQLLASGIKASGLYDHSHGAGVLPTAWPSLKEDWSVGYAGGLGPDNIKDQLPAINEAAGSRPFWIDMETRVRSKINRHDLFDTHKCLEVLRVCAAGISV